MMNEWGVPPIELWSLFYRYLAKLDKNGRHIPDAAIASGISMEDQMFKGLALGAPYFKMIGMARAPLAAAMVGKNIGHCIEKEDLPVYISRFGQRKDEIFETSPELKKRYGQAFDDIPTGAIGLYTYLKRLNQGLRQIMCGSRKFTLSHIDRNDISALTREAGDISDIQYIMDCDREEVDKILA
jgi:glutamate synthase domain-containing protein 2